MKKLLLLLMCIITTALYAIPTIVPINNEVYSFIERMEIKGFVKKTNSRVKPFTRDKVANLLAYMEKRSAEMTEVERNLLGKYINEFRPELKGKRYYKSVDGGVYSPFVSWTNFKRDLIDFFVYNDNEDNYMAIWEDKGNSLYFHLGQKFRYDNNQDYYRYYLDHSFQFYGAIEENLGYYFDFYSGKILGDDEYVRSDFETTKGYYKYRDGIIYDDDSFAEVYLQNKYIDIAISKVPLTWGLGTTGQLFLSTNSVPFPCFKLHKSFDFIEFDYIHASILDNEAPIDTINGDHIRTVVDRYISAHSVTLKFDWINFNFTEAVVYANRGMEMAYFIPQIFLRPAEHKLKDRDNAIMQLSTEIFPVSSIRLYGELLLDDLKFAEINSKWYGNKQAYQVGCNYVDPFGLSNASLDMEYTKLRPWTYTHKFKVNSFSNDGKGLGYYLGPNSDHLYFNFSYNFSHRLRANVYYSKIRRGENDLSAEDEYDLDFGGDVMNGQDGEEGVDFREEISFLEGILHRDNIFGFKCVYEVFNDNYLRLEYFHRESDIENQDSESEDSFSLKYEFRY